MATSAMNKFRDQLEKRYGTRLTQTKTLRAYQIVSTGSLTLDIAMRTGGWIRGRTHEIVGQAGSAKTTISILSAVEHQKAEPKLAVGWIDMEHSFDFAWANALGLDTSEARFTHVLPDDSEDVADIIKMMSQTELFSMIVVDSIGGMESKKAFEKDAEDVVMGKNAQVITRMVKQVATLAHMHKITVIFVNQLRANLSGMGMDKPAGPKALGYNTTMSVSLSRKGGPQSDTTRLINEPGEDKPVPVGLRFVGKVTRSRVAPQGRQAEFWLMNVPTPDYGPVGINRADEALNVGLRMGVITQAGAFYTLPGQEKAIQGRDRVSRMLNQDPALTDLVRTKALEMIKDEVHQETVVEFKEDTDE